MEEIITRYLTLKWYSTNISIFYIYISIKDTAYALIMYGPEVQFNAFRKSWEFYHICI